MSADSNGNRSKDRLKRVFDLSISLPGLILISPLVMVLSIIVLAVLGRPVIFTQVRPGLKGRPFKLYKFRTMVTQYDKKGKPLPDSMRLTMVGRFLRSTSLDELPEIVNVIKGDMSLVGPRPLLMEYVPLYSEEQKRRHEVKPGITGWAQVNGRNAITWEEKFNHDVWYVDNHSFLLDVKILLMTLFSVCKREGISQVGHSTMEKFRGTKNAER